MAATHPGDRNEVRLMGSYVHKVGAVYAGEPAALDARGELLEHGFEEPQVVLIEPPPDAGIEEQLEPEGHEVSVGVGSGALAGGGIGPAAGAVSTAALGVTGATLLVSTPLMGALMITGYAATIGGTVGALKGLHFKDTVFDSVLTDAARSGYWAVVAYCRDDREQSRARALLGRTAEEQAVTS